MSFIRVRQRDPSLFYPTGIKTVPIDLQRGISAQCAQSRRTNSPQIQSLLFDHDKWSLPAIRQWIKDHPTYSYPVREDFLAPETVSMGVAVPTVRAPFIIQASIQGVEDPDYSVLRLIIIREGPGKNQVILDQDGEIYVEFFTLQVLEELQGILEGTQFEAYRVAGTNVYGDDGLVHPSPQISKDTPQGLVLHNVGFMRDLHIAPDPDDEERMALHAVAVLNESQAGLDLRETIRAARERGSLYIPAPSINGFMLWMPERDGNYNYFKAYKVLSHRSTEFVNRPAAGGQIYAVLEGETMNLLQMLKQYCQAAGIAFDEKADTPGALLQSITAPDETLNQVSTALETDESGALAVLSTAMETATIQTQDAGSQPAPASSPQQPAAAVGQKPAAPAPAPKAQASTTPQAKAPVTQTPAKAASPVSQPSPSIQPQAAPQMPVGGGDAMNVGELAEAVTSQVMQQLTGQFGQINTAIGTLSKNQKAFADFMAGHQSRATHDTLIAYVQEAIPETLSHRRVFWTDRINAGQFKDLATLKLFIDADVQTEQARAAQVMEDMSELPVSVRHMAGIAVEANEEDKPKLRTKLMFALPVTESEQNVINASGLRPYQGIADMYHSIVPGDPDVTGLPYGGDRSNPRYQSWARQMMGGISGGPEVVRSTDFTGILLEVVGELAAARWETMDRSYLDLCEIGPQFTNYRESNVVVAGASPDMKKWDEVTGYPDLETGARQKVTTKVDDYGGILRWSKRVVIDDENGSSLQLILDDVAGAVEATWRVIGKSIVNEAMGWGGNPLRVNGKKFQDGRVLYEEPDVENSPRRNLVIGDGRDYDNIVALLHLMLSQEDIAKPEQDPQPLVLVPGRVMCVNTAWTRINDYFNRPYKPGTENEANELGLPVKPKVVGLHRVFLHGREDFLAMMPDPMLKGVIRLQYYRNRRSPSIVWQNQSFAGRNFENGEIACQLDMPVRVTTVRPKGLYSVHKQL